MSRKEVLFPEQEVLLSLLRERLDGWGIETACWDFDGTLVNTRVVFNQAMIDAVGLLLFGKEWISEQAERDKEKLRQVEELKESVLDKLVWGLRPELGVNPVILEVAAKLTAQILGRDLEGDQVERALDRIRDIYLRDVPPVFEGAREAVEIINKAGRRSVLMTHAEPEWTWIKRIGTGFVGMFEQVVHFSIDQPKSVQWAEQIRLLGVEPEALLIVGDNFEADIRPPVEMGARGIWVTNRRTRVFDGELDREQVLDELKERVINVEQTGDIIGAIIQGG